MITCVKCGTAYAANEPEPHTCPEEKAQPMKIITLDDLHNMVQEIRDHLEMDTAAGQVTPSEDNWKHRAENMRCQTCMWYVPKSDRLGRCRYNAPTIKGWPAMFPTDWCGQHKLDENKIEGRD